MILPPPQPFDANEWFILGATAVGLCGLLPFRRTFDAFEFLSIWLFNLFLVHAADFLLAGEPVNIYDINDSNKFELADAFMYVVTYPPPCLIVCGLYARWRPGPWGLVFLLAAAAAASTGLEWLAAKARIYHYHGWRSEWSAAVYMFAYAANIAYFRWLRRVPRSS